MTRPISRTHGRPNSRHPRALPGSLLGSGLCLLALAAGTACASRAAPPPAMEPRADSAAVRMVAAPPVHALLGHRERLALTSEQIVALDSIGTWLDRSNRPLLGQLQELRERGGAWRRLGGGSDAGSGEALSLLLQLSEHNQAAIDGVRALLTPEQQQRVCETYAAPRRGENRRGGRYRSPEEERAAAYGRRTGSGGPGGARAAGPVWSWCQPPPPAPPPTRE